ncbi:hypothetical protein CU664_18085 [Pseudomonas syringae pv. actinidifoliorum]|uniref:polymorphic toxin type 33 domain-containing protein n=1 Tax=Pseudomonas syringae TaxID=317 RepID=UPI00137275B7|nr:hypothetical protein [Pseudomonas syringae pv. actinidifoliorum]NAT65058.1 hypothetical protein [Pseudomonas syringae pv. actinidifoliorum]
MCFLGRSHFLVRRSCPGSVDHYNPDDLKAKKSGSKYDLFKDKNGNITVKLKAGNGLGESTGININHC